MKSAQTQIFQHWELIKMNFYDMINHPHNIGGYKCDRCEMAQLILTEYVNNWKLPHHYCQECWNWIHLQKWTDQNGNKHTLRSERKIHDA